MLEIKQKIMYNYRKHCEVRLCCFVKILQNAVATVNVQRFKKTAA